MDLCDALPLALDARRPDVVAFVGAGGKTSALLRLTAELAARDVRVLISTTTHLAAEQVARWSAVLEVDDGPLPLPALRRELARHRRLLLIQAGTGARRAGLLPEQVDSLARNAEELGVQAILIEADGSRQLPLKAPAAHEPAAPASTTLLVPVAGVEAAGRPLDAVTVHRPDALRRVLGLEAAASPRLTPRMVARALVDDGGGGKHRPAQARLVPLLNKVETAVQIATARVIARYWVDQGLYGLLGAVGRAQGTPVQERWAPWAVVILAAGSSTRMGRAKQLLPVAGELMVRQAVQTALGSDADQVVVVTGAYGDEVSEALADFKSATGRVRLVHNPDWSTGQATSMQTGLAALPPTMAAAVFLPVDQPFAPASLLRRLARRWRSGAALAAPRVDGEVRGAPALFDRSIWPALHRVEGDMGGRSVLRANPHLVSGVDAPAEWLYDVDTQADLAAL